MNGEKCKCTEVIRDEASGIGRGHEEFCVLN